MQKDLLKEYIKEGDAMAKGKLLCVDGKNKPVIALEGLVSMLSLWGLQNTYNKRTTYIAKPDGTLLRVYKGTGGRNFPEIDKCPSAELIMEERG